MRELIKYPIAIVLLVTTYRFSKIHRQEDTWIFRYLNSTAANILANNLKFKITGKY